MRIVCCLTMAGLASMALGAPAISWREIASPARDGSLAPAITAGSHAQVWMSWIEPAPTGGHALRIASLEADRKSWDASTTIASDATVSPHGSDMPQVAVDGRETIYALWIDGHGGARFSESKGGSRTWTPSRPWAEAGTSVEKLTTVRLADGRVLAAWLQSKSDGKNPNVTQLVARLVGIADQRDEVVAAPVCDCCQLGLTPLLDAGALLAYRGVNAESARDIYVARRRYGRWSEPRILNNDDWRLQACPVNGPRIAGDGSRAAAAWYTASDGEPRVLASYTPDAGARWLMPLRVDRGQPLGHVETVFLRDGAFVVLWLETDGSLWLRRITPEFVSTEPVALAPAGTVSLRGWPRAVLQQDYSGGPSHASMVVAYPVGGPSTGIRTLVVDIPEGDLVDAERNCACAPTSEQLQGFPIRGTIREVDAPMKSAQVAHEEVPGVFERGVHVFGIAPAEFSQLQRGRQFLGRVTWRDGAWRLFDIRLLSRPAN